MYGIYLVTLLLYLFVIEGTDVSGQNMFDYITGDLKPWRALAGTWTLLHIAEVSVYFTCYVVQRNYPREFSIKNEALALLLISYFSNSYYEIGFKISSSEIDVCDNGIIPTQILVDILRTVSVFLIILQSQRLVYHGIPPPPADCLESLDIIMISSYQFVPIFEKFIREKHPT